MNDFENLIEAAKRGAAEEVSAIARVHADLINQRDASGATALHYAPFGGHRQVVQVLVEHGADSNAADSKFGATPAGWAIEYLREMGAFLGIELGDLATPSGEATSTGSRAFSLASQNFVMRVTPRAAPSNNWPGKPAILKS